VVAEAMAEKIMEQVVRPIIGAMAAEGCPYKGVLYAGLMIADDQPKVLEFNVRFGDPECQPLMMRLKSDILDVLLACVDGTLDQVVLEWHDVATLIVVMATKGYPDWYENGSKIRGLEKAQALNDVAVFHAGTRAENGDIVAHGGRVLGVTARGVTVAEARERAYQAVGQIDWPEGFWRRDIGWRAIDR
jgi:phosphoribosylamine--glycine ligase